MDEIKVGDRVRLAATALMKCQHPELLGREFFVTEIRSDGVMLDEWLIADGYQLEVLDERASISVPWSEGIEDRLEKLALRLRREGVIFGPERDLMVDAANLLRTMRTELVSR